MAHQIAIWSDPIRGRTGLVEARGQEGRLVVGVRWEDLERGERCVCVTACLIPSP